MAEKRGTRTSLQLLLLLCLLRPGLSWGGWKDPGPDLSGQPVFRSPSACRWEEQQTLSRLPDGAPTCGGAQQEQNQTQTPQEAADPRPPLEWQQILMLQEDAVVRRAASALFHQHPAGSSLFALDQNQTATLVRGRRGPLSGSSSSLVLVGHGARDASGDMRLSGYTSQELARIIQSASRLSASIQSTRLLGCRLGSDPAFIESLLRELQRAGVQTELHLWSAAVQVTDRGQILTKDASQWRHRDSSKKVVAAIDRRGRLSRRQEGGGRGEPVPTTDANALHPPKKKKQPAPPKKAKADPPGPIGDNNRFQKYRQSWPTGKKGFIDPEVYNKLDQNKFAAIEEMKQVFKVLEDFSWLLFHSQPNQPLKEEPESSTKETYVIIDHTYDKDRIEVKENWIDDDDKLEMILDLSYKIESGEDIRNIIRHYAKYGEDVPTYLMVNNWIFFVHPINLYMYPVGKHLDNNQKEDEGKIAEVKRSIKAQKGKEKYPDITSNIFYEANGREIYAEYARNIFQGEVTKFPSVSMEAWCTTYFTASVIAESARNFRTFPLILMALDMSESLNDNVRNNGLNSLYCDHPMARGKSWIDPSRRGFSGSATPADSSKLTNSKPVPEEELMDDLTKLIKMEFNIFRNWKESIKKEKPQGKFDKILSKYNTSVDDTNKEKGVGLKE
ncbi:uncharacterized protein ACNS7B_011137 [Menidia menidia]